MPKFKESLTALIGDFANMNRTPDFKAKSESKDAESVDGEKEKERKHQGGRRHSLNITVGAEELPQIPKRNRSESIAVGSSQLPPQSRGRRSSAPCVSSSVASSQLRQKIKKMRSKDDCFAEQSKIEEEDDETITEAEEKAIFTKLAAQNERRPSSYLL
ncbi:unnamed protein product, partial [Mesorhabditis belari]|uniref:Uncharacterized protein n=1 Tax=Mesorhabditis belari TaxID=2138241 RepID=A0AAF3EU81_9BILA